MSDSPSTGKKRKPINWMRTIIFAAVAVGVYVGYTQWQSHLGRQAAANTGIVSIPMDEATQLASQSGRDQLVLVSATWCIKCRLFDEDVLSQPEVGAAISDQFVFTRLDPASQEGKAFAQTYGLRGVPSLVQISPDSRTVTILKTPLDPAMFIAQLRP